MDRAEGQQSRIRTGQYRTDQDTRTGMDWVKAPNELNDCHNDIVRMTRDDVGMDVGATG